MNQDRLALFKEHYFFELDRKHKLTTACSVPLGLLAISGGAAAFYLKGVTDSGTHLSPVAAVLLLHALIAAIICAIPGIWFLVRAYHGHTYKYLPTPTDVNTYHKGLVKFHQESGGTGSEADEELSEFLLNEYAKCAHNNTLINDARSAYLHSANGLIIAVGVIALVSAFPYFLGSSFGKSETGQKVELVVTDKAYPLLLTQPTSVVREVVVTKPQTPTPPPQRPAPPPSRDVREGVIPRPTKPPSQ